MAYGLRKIRKEKGKKEGKQNRRTREEGKAFLFLWRKIGVVPEEKVLQKMRGKDV